MAYVRDRRYGRRRRRQRNQLILLSVVLVILLAVIVGIVIGIVKENRPDNTEDTSVTESTETGTENDTQDDERAEINAIIAEADLLAAGYDYDAAIAKIQSIEGYEQDGELLGKIVDYEAIKASCKRVKISEVTHIFYHSLVVDPDRAFDPNKSNGEGMNQWMTTVDEFMAITQEMYDRGYVLVSLHDLYEITVDENGNKVIKEGNIYLPEGKKAFVLSLDDLSYYHSYDGYGLATKLLVDEEGNLYNEYIDAQGNVLYGDYDCVPLLDKFIEEHPDASYRGAKGTVALTGYNGIFGYRTDYSYSLDTPDLNKDKRDWLVANPDFDIEAERAAAKEVADAMKAKGWTFASHTWGHLSVGGKQLSTLQKDNEKWMENVATIVGDTNVIIFAHGTDLGNWGKYDEANEKYQYYKEQGFDIFCNVDGSQKYLVYMGKDYLRMGRRNLDGIRFHYNLTGTQNNLSDLFDVQEIVDPKRPSMDAYK
ncbi:MAG: polysaccharide deacetylase [Agathobacter sp.]|nr:polysaccharide deacetylase [Agathobacter sp.]